MVFGRRGRWLGVAFAIVCFGILGPSGASGAVQKVGKIVAIRGKVEIFHPGEKGFRPAKLYEDVFVKDQIRTGPQSRAKILYDDDSLTILSENSSIEIREYQLTRDKKRKRSLIGLLAGKLRFIVTKYLIRKKANFFVQTPTAVMGVRGSDSVAVFKGNTTYAYHLFGDLEITNSITGEKLIIKSGEWAIIHPDGSMETGVISTEELERLLEFFSTLPDEEQRKYWEKFQDELGEILPEPDREPEQFIKEPSGPKGIREDGSGGYYLETPGGRQQ